MRAPIETLVLCAPPDFMTSRERNGTASTLESISAGARGLKLGDLTLQTGPLDPVERARIEAEPGTLLAVRKMPFTLIKPLAKAQPVAVQEPAWGIGAVGALGADEKAGAGVIVAVLDTGIIEDFKTHPAFKNVEIVQKNLTDGPDHDIDGHGTHCAGTIFGHDVDGQRIGIARGIKRALIGKIIGKRGSSTETIYRGITWALSQEAHIISMSLGIDFPGYQQELVDKEYEPIEATSIALEGYRDCIRMFDLISHLVTQPALKSATSVVVAAAGNESSRPDYTIAVAPPAAGESFVSVGALGRGGKGKFDVASFSNHSPTIAAPGVDIVSVGLTRALESMSGTSMATPHVAGLAALWASHGVTTKNFSAGEVIQLLKTNVDPLAYLSRKDVGSGLAKAPIPPA